MNNKQQGFSLVELMVIAIIAILSAIAVPNYKSYVIRARVAELLTIAENIQLRVSQKYNEGTTWSAITDLGYTAAPTSTYITTTAAAPTVAATTAAVCPAGSTGIGSISVTGNTAAIGIASGNLGLVKVGCMLNDIITWVCGVKAADAANVIYLPSNCQSITMLYP